MLSAIRATSTTDQQKKKRLALCVSTKGMWWIDWTFTFQQCCGYHMVMFKHKNHLLMVRKGLQHPVGGYDPSRRSSDVTVKKQPLSVPADLLDTQHWLATSQPLLLFFGLEPCSAAWQASWPKSAHIHCHFRNADKIHIKHANKTYLGLQKLTMPTFSTGDWAVDQHCTHCGHVDSKR